MRKFQHQLAPLKVYVYKISLLFILDTQSLMTKMTISHTHTHTQMFTYSTSGNLASGHELPELTRKFLNRFRIQVGRSMKNLFSWFMDSVPQTIMHLISIISCLACPDNCMLEELMDAIDSVLLMANFWVATE